MKSYDEVEYWNNRENPNSATQEGTLKHIDFVRRSVKDCKDILEFGPGIGRTFRAYVGMGAKIAGYDISKQYSKEALSRAKALGLDFKLSVGNKITELPYDDDQFDCAVAVSVLLHQRTDHIIPVMSELSRVAKKVIIIAWHEPGKTFSPPYSKQRAGDYCFNYDYPAICKLKGWDIIHKHNWNKQLFFIYSSE